MCSGPHPFIPLPKGAQVAIRYDFLGQQVENIIWATIPTGPTPANLDNLANAVASSWQTYVRPQQSVQLTIREVVATDWTVEEGNQVVVSTFASPNGGLTGDPLPSTCAMKVGFKRSVRSPAKAAGIFHVGITEDLISGNTFTPAYVSAVEDAWRNVGADLISSGWTHVIASFCRNNLWLVNGIWQPVGNYVGKPTIATQRRRGPGRGN